MATPNIKSCWNPAVLGVSRGFTVSGTESQAGRFGAGMQCLFGSETGIRSAKSCYFYRFQVTWKNIEVCYELYFTPVTLFTAVSKASGQTDSQAKTRDQLGDAVKLATKLTAISSGPVHLGLRHNQQPIIHYCHPLSVLHTRLQSNHQPRIPCD